MYKIKQIPEDFIVKEKIEIDIKDKGTYTYCKLTKKDYNLQKAIDIIAKRIRVRIKDIGFAGTKDRRAVTEQVISIKRANKEQIEKNSFEDIQVEPLGYGEEPISLGDLEGNNFEITIRNVDTKPKNVKRIVNYFGEQRFGKNNVEVGRAIIKKDFAKAAELLRDENNVNEHLEKDNNDHVGAIKKMPKKTLRLIINSYQSWIWNKTAEEIVDKNLEIENVPIVGFGSELEGETGKIIKRIMKEEDIVLRDFIIKQLPELSPEGNERKLYCNIEDLDIGELEDDELNEEKKKVKIKFFLKKGCYATEVLKALTQESPHNT